MMEPITTRWWVSDPLAEKYYNISPYAYCGNDPINFIDPNGEERYKVGASFAMNSGFVGAAAKLFGLGLAYVQTLGGGAKIEVSVYLMYDSDKKQFGIGASHTMTDYVNSSDYTFGVVNGSESKERSTTRDANTIDGASKKEEKTFSEKSSDGIAIKDVSLTDDKEGSVGASVGVSVNAAIVGVEAKAEMTKEPEPKNP